MAELAAEKRQAERDKRARPTSEAKSPPAQPTPPTTEPAPAPAPAGKPNPLAVEWAKANDWFGKDAIATMAARVIDQQMVADGFDPSDPDYFVELDKRLRAELPHKFTQGAKPAKQLPTVQNRAAALPAGTKMKVTITQADRAMAEHLNIPIEEYARQKARREMASNAPNGYTEIV